MKLQPLTAQIDEFMLYCESKGLSKKTLSSYEQALKLFSRFLTETFDVTDAKQITAEMIRKYIKHLQERGKYTVACRDSSWASNQPDNRKDYGKKVSPATINNYIRNIKCVFNFFANCKCKLDTPDRMSTGS